MKPVIACAIGLLAVTAAVFLAGCDTTTTDAVILVTPSTASVSSGSTVLLTASLPTNAATGLFLPLVWEVGDPDVGVISESAGHTAVYSARKSGSNVVLVKDQSDAEGQAAITR